jgi:hypothetical protein
MDTRRSRTIRLADLIVAVMLATSCVALTRVILLDHALNKSSDDLRVAIDLAVGLVSFQVSFGLAAARIARRRGRNPSRWFLLGCLGTWLVVYLVWRLPAIPGDRRRPPGPSPRDEPAGPSPAEPNRGPEQVRA